MRTPSKEDLFTPNALANWVGGTFFFVVSVIAWHDVFALIAPIPIITLLILSCLILTCIQISEHKRSIQVMFSAIPPSNAKAYCIWLERIYSLYVRILAWLFTAQATALVACISGYFSFSWQIGTALTLTIAMTVRFAVLFWLHSVAAQIGFSLKAEQQGAKDDTTTLNATSTS